MYSKAIFLKVYIFVLILAISIKAQITIQSSEYDITLGTTHTLYSAEDTTEAGFTVNVGTTGGPQTWTFTEEQFPDGYFE
ncbi:MAG: hypothetical protein P8Y99_06270, partial [Calditrichaceae bacterium]